MSLSRSLALWRLTRAIPRTAFLAASRGGVQFRAPCTLPVAAGRRLSSGADNPNTDPGPTPHPDTESEPDPTATSDTDEDLPRAVLEASLQFVPEHGWTARALAEGAKSLGAPAIAHGMFPRGGAELIDHFEIQSNAELVEYMQNAMEEHSVKGSELLLDSVEQRLRMIVPFIDKWPQAMVLKAYPSNAPHALHNLALMVDDIWFCAGDRSTDFNWYTKRALLASIYSSTEVYMIQDASVDFQDTWDFLRRRLEDANTFAKSSSQMQDFLSGGLGVLSAGFTTALNMLGMNSRNR